MAMAPEKRVLALVHGVGNRVERLGITIFEALVVLSGGYYTLKVVDIFVDK